MDKKRFGLFIKESRKNKNLTQKELADLLFIDITAISKWERGVSYPDITLIPEICKILDVSEHELIESSTDTNYRNVLKDAKKYNKQKKLIFYISSIIYVVAIFTCFIVNLAVNHALSWFFVVLTSCVCGFTFVPTILRFFDKQKLLIFLVSTLLSMFIMFTTISIYTDSYWFMIATLGVILGYFVVFFPILVIKQKSYLKEDSYNKYKKYFLITYSLIIYVLTIFLLISINSFRAFDINKALAITSYSFTIFIAIGIVDMFKIQINIKVSSICVLIAFYLLGLYYVLNNLIDEYNTTDLSIDFKDFAAHSNGNTALIIFTILGIIGIINIIIGIKKIINKK